MLRVNITLTGQDILNPEIRAAALELLAAGASATGETATRETALDRFNATHGLNWQRAPKAGKGELALRAEIEGAGEAVDWSDIEARHAALVRRGWNIIEVRRAGGESRISSESAEPSIDLDALDFSRPKV